MRSHAEIARQSWNFRKWSALVSAILGRARILICKGVSVKSGGRHGCPCWQNKNGRDEEDTQKIIENVKKKHAKNKAYAKNGVGFTVSAFLERQILA